MAESTPTDMAAVVADLQRRLQGVVVAVARIGPAIPAFRELLRVAERYAPSDPGMAGVTRLVDETLVIVERCFVELSEVQRRIVEARS